jgi:hypothetical protein
VRHEGEGTVQVSLQPFDKHWQKNAWIMIHFSRGSTAWQAFDRTLTLPDWAAQLGVNVVVEREGRAWLDDLDVRVIEEADNEWKSVFNGKDLTGWLHYGGRVWVENGVLAFSGRAADLYYKANWDEYALEMDVMADVQGNGHAVEFELSKTTYANGRASPYRVVVSLGGHGAAHVRAGGDRAAPGWGKFKISQWRRVRMDVTRTELKLYSDGTPVGSVSLEKTPQLRGGVMIGGHGPTVRLRNMRVRPLGSGAAASTVE